MQVFIEYEQFWRLSLRSAGVGLFEKVAYLVCRKVGYLIVFLLVLGVLVWLIFR